MSAATSSAAAPASQFAPQGAQMDEETRLMMLQMEHAGGVRQFENTYKMKPDRKFQSEPVQRLIQDILARTLKDKTYSSEATPEWTKTISQEIMTAIKKLNYDRYKLVVDVTIGEIKGQGVRCASRCLWDTETDSYATGTFKNATIFAIATAFGCFYE